MNLFSLLCQKLFHFSSKTEVIISKYMNLNYKGPNSSYRLAHNGGGIKDGKYGNCKKGGWRLH